MNRIQFVGELELDVIASETEFSGVVRVDRGDRVEIVKAYGLAHRSYDIPNEVDTRFALASGTKGLTALTVVSLVEDGTLQLTTTARSVLGKDIPLVGDGVTVEHLLAHRSGIGDYLDRRLASISRVSDARPRARARDDGGLPRGSRRPPTEVRARRALCLLQQRLRRARAHRRACDRHSLPRARAVPRLRARGDARHRVPALGRAPGSNGSWLPRGQRHVEDERLPSARPRIGRRRHLLDRR